MILYKNNQKIEAATDEIGQLVEQGWRPEPQSIPEGKSKIKLEIAPEDRNLKIKIIDLVTLNTKIGRISWLISIILLIICFIIISIGLGVTPKSGLPVFLIIPGAVFGFILFIARFKDTGVSTKNSIIAYIILFVMSFIPFVNLLTGIISWLALMLTPPGVYEKDPNYR